MFSLSALAEGLELVKRRVLIRRTKRRSSCRCVDSHELKRFRKLQNDHLYISLALNSSEHLKGHFCTLTLFQQQVQFCRSWVPRGPIKKHQLTCEGCF